MMEVPQIDIRETGKNIRRMRTERGIRVTEISDALMIDKQAVYRWEYGKSLPQLENCLALARMFHTTIEDILVEKGEAYPPLPSHLPHFVKDFFRQHSYGRRSLPALFRPSHP